MSKRMLLAVLLSAAVVGLPACGGKSATPSADPLLRAYDVEPDWNDPQRIIPLNYQQAQGKRLFYEKCVWCHADSTPAGPSNRNNVTPAPALMNDGNALNNLSDEYLQNITALGGSAMGKSATMPPWGRTLTQDEIRAIVAYARAIAQPPYRPPVRPGPSYPAK
jgi:mono/diheme cytochrome c family protein